MSKPNAKIDVLQTSGRRFFRIKFYLPLTGDVHFDERYEAWKKQQIVFHQTVAGKERRKAS